LSDVENGWTRSILIGAVVAIIIAITGARYFLGVGLPSQITLINRSAETVRDARLKQGDRETTLGQIEPGQMRSADFVAGEGSLTLTVTFASGRTISADNVGYTVAAIPVIVRFTVDGDKVELLDITNRNPKPLF
jgi:hypothetical protein